MCPLALNLLMFRCVLSLLRSLTAHDAGAHTRAPLSLSLALSLTLSISPDCECNLSFYSLCIGGSPGQRKLELMTVEELGRGC